jgi:hypothetical protein
MYTYVHIYLNTSTYSHIHTRMYRYYDAQQPASNNNSYSNQQFQDALSGKENLGNFH